MINFACGVIRISIKYSCLKIFDQQESFKLDMIDLACGVIRISNNIIVLRYSINKVIRILLPLSWFPHIIWYQSFRLKIGYMFPLRFFSICLEIFDQQGNLNLTSLVVISPYHRPSSAITLLSRRWTDFDDFAVLTIVCFGIPLPRCAGGSWAPLVAAACRAHPR